MVSNATTPPTAQELATAADLPVLAADGTSRPLGQLMDNVRGRAVVIFIRHFYCGLCQDYLSYLSTHISPSALSSSNVKLSIVGCGDASLIQPYKDSLGLPAEFEVFADPTKKTYEALGMTLRTLEMGKETPYYQRAGVIGNALQSILSAFKLRKLTTSPGDLKQLGGEFVFGPGREPLYTHRMENTRGHAPLNELLQAAGLPLESA
ncbi:hypothetical protein JCM8097_002507 [Rhodosporidiobolus ruineniae]